MSKLHVADLEITEFIWRRIDSYPNFNMCIGWKDEDGPIGGFIIHGYTGRGGSCRVHYAGKPGWLTRQKLSQMAAYLFTHLDCNRIYGEVPASKVGVLEIDKKIGFMEIARLGGYFAGGETCVLLELKREDCRWLDRRQAGIAA